jgi:Mce-associated membrane protein
MTVTGADVKAAGFDGGEAVISDEAETATPANSQGDTDGENSPGPTREAHCGNGTGRFRWRRVLAYALIPGLALMLAVGAGYLKWRGSSIRASQLAAVESVHAATDSTVVLLTYTPASVEKDLTAARQRLTGRFRDSYTMLARDVIIPGSKQKQISAVASVRAAASVSASPEHAVALLFVNQIVNVGNDPPISTASSVRVTLERVDGRWLISQYDPL